MKTINTLEIPIDPHILKNWVSDSSPFSDGFHIEKIESYKDNLKLPLQPHRRSVYFFMFVTKGKAIRSKGLTNYEVLPNDCFFLPAYQITSLDYVSDDAQGFYCHFSPEIFNHPWIKNPLNIDFPFFQLVGNPLVHIKDPDKLIPLLKILESRYNEKSKENINLLGMYLLTLLTEFSLQTGAVQKQKMDSAAFFTQRYKDALAEFIYEKKTVAEYADYLAVTDNKLQRCVKATTGKSAHQLLDEMRLLEAKVLLQQSPLSIAEIAYKIGGFNPSDFSRFFKSKTNMTPQQYRQS